MSLFLLSALVLLGVMTALWLVSLAVKDSSIVDLFWGAGFVLVSWLSVASAGASPRGLLAAGLVSAWGLRLAGYLAWRNLGKGEDKRYQAMRRARGAAWWWKSFFIVFLLQGVLLWVVSLPLQVAASRGGPLSPWDALPVAVFAVGLAFEAVGDLQLARFKRTHKGQVMDRGLWRYTRHPNYFGDFLVWWGLYGVALVGGGWWTVVSPLVMSVLLMRVSGVTLLEQSMKARPGYEDYVRRTSAFFPRPPRA